MISITLNGFITGYHKVHVYCPCGEPEVSWKGREIPSDQVIYFLTLCCHDLVGRAIEPNQISFQKRQEGKRKKKHNPLFIFPFIACSVFFFSFLVLCPVL